MDISLFSNPKRFFIITVFIDESSLKENRRILEKLSNQKNVTLVVQPSPYEAVEFLYRVVSELPAHFQSIEKELFWEAIEIQPDTPKEIVTTLSTEHHRYLCDILEHNIKRIPAYKTLITANRHYLARDK